MSLSSALATRPSPGETQADPLGPHCRPRRGKWAHRAGGGGSSGGGLGPLCVTEAELSSVLPRAAPSHPSPVPARLKGSPHADTASRSGVPAGLSVLRVRPTDLPPTAAALVVVPRPALPSHHVPHSATVAVASPGPSLPAAFRAGGRESPWAPAPACSPRAEASSPADGQRSAPESSPAPSLLSSFCVSESTVSPASIAPRPPAVRGPSALCQVLC